MIIIIIQVHAFVSLIKCYILSHLWIIIIIYFLSNAHAEHENRIMA